MDAKTTARASSPETIIGQLNQEWERLQTDETVTQRLRRWAEEDARLDDAVSLAELQDIARRPVTEATDHFFAALLERAVVGDADGELAARIVLQLMLGRVVITARSLTRFLHSREEQAQVAVVSMWETIREFPLQQRSRYITPYMAWTAHHRAKRQAQVAAREIPSEAVEDEAATPQGLHPSEELMRVLTWAVAESVVTQDEATLLLERYGTTSPGRRAWSSLGDPDTIARRHDSTPAAVRQRCSRAARKLSQAAARYVATNVF